jgi:MFS family permease
VTVKERGSLFLFARYWKESPPNYRRLAGALLLFTLFNSSDVFLLLRMKEAGFSDSSVISAYIFYNLVYAAFSYPLGILADRLGMKKIFIGGMLLFALVYFLMSFQQSRMVYYFIFLVYGVYAAATEGVAKAWISNICEKKDTATAIGTYTAFQSLATLIASSGAGLLWFTFGPGAVFISSAVVAILVALYVSRIREQAIVT